MVTAWGEHTVLAGDPLDKGCNGVEAQGLPNDWIKRVDFICFRRRDRPGGDLGTQKYLLGGMIDCL